MLATYATLIQFVIVIGIMLRKSVSLKNVLSRSNIAKLSLKAKRFSTLEKIDHRAISKIVPGTAVENESYCNILETYLHNHLINDCGVSKDANIFMSVSGGSDSMCMFHLLNQVKTRFLPELKLTVVHFNHKLRPESDEEAMFVKSWAEKEGNDFFTAELPKDLRTDVGLQANARKWRRQVSLDLISNSSLSPDSSKKSHLIMTAHHKGDQIETTLIKFLRGVHISNLHGMKSVDGLFLKPFLHLSKLQLQQYLLSKKLTWYEDSSNQSRKYKRNKIRLDLIPLLAEITGDEETLYKRLFNLSEQSNEIDDLLESQIMKVGKSLVYREFPDTESPFSLVLNEEFRNLSDIVKSTLLHRWITFCLMNRKKMENVEISSNKMTIITDSLKNSLISGKRSKAIPLVNGWEIVIFGSNELRIKEINPENIGFLTTKKVYNIMMNSESKKKINIEVSHLKSFEVEISMEQCKKVKNSENIKKMNTKNSEFKTSDNYEITLDHLPLKDYFFNFRYTIDGDDFTHSKKEKNTKVKKILKTLPGHDRDRILVLIDTNLENTREETTVDEGLNEKTDNSVIGIFFNENDVRLSNLATNYDEVYQDVEKSEKRKLMSVTIKFKRIPEFSPQMPSFNWKKVYDTDIDTPLISDHD